SALAYAFYDWNGLARGEFVGFDNFRRILFDEPWAGWTRNAFRHNVIVFLTLMVVQNGAGFVLAYALWREPWGAAFHRVAVFLPVILSTVIIGFLWKLFFHPLFGVVNQSLKAIGLGFLAQPWLGQSETALGALIFVNAWAWVGFPTLVFLAGMQRIPPELLDAARMETDSEWVVVRKIVWPLVAPSATIVFILLFIGSFNWFELPYIMVGLDGSPFGSTDVLGLYFYRTAFGNQSAGVQDFGTGSALAVLTFLFIAVVAAFWTIHLRKREVQV
ncbi:MAG: sugar ABC transporter permease, partial [Rhodobacteraceae bacterium]|nr:sugar ABC transporter permease [Paracoccaceae bacterium]